MSDANAIHSLQRSVRRLSAAVAALSLVLVVGAVSAFRTQQPSVLRVRGIIVEDAAGLGASVLIKPFELDQLATSVERALIPRVY